MSYIISISNEKGGVAKTTTSLSLGAALAEVAKKVLLIDFDPQANLTLGVGLEPSKTGRTASNVLLDAEPLLNACQPTNMTGVDIVPANAGMEHAEQTLPIYMNYANRLRDAILAAGPLPYDYIIIDCPPSLGSVTTNALSASNLLIIPTQAEYFSAYALRDMMAVIRKVRAEGNPGLAYRILITLLDQRNRAHRDIREQLERTFGIGLFNTIIEIDTKLRESPILGLPITQYRPHSRGALQYRNLAEELIQYVQSNQ
jgi:chromosome partitioning protein